MSTITQLNWHQRYLSTVSELHQARLENDRLQAKIDELMSTRSTLNSKVLAERDMLAKKVEIIREALL